MYEYSVSSSNGEISGNFVMAIKTKEPYYQTLLDIKAAEGLTQLGLTTNQAWRDDPRHLLFTLSRYKFVSKILAGKKSVLEVGCGDAFGSRIVLQEIDGLCAVDVDPVFVDDVNSRMSKNWAFECRVHDILSGPVKGDFEAAYSMDVIEHVEQKDEHIFVKNIALSLQPNGVLIIGSPSIQSQTYASEHSKNGHRNCKDAPGLKALLQRHFHNIFMFSMNDEVVHTGYHPMAHYLLALCVGQK